MKISLVLSTYKSPRFLECVLESLLRQTRAPFEVLVAEDGEFTPNRQVIEKYRSQIPFRLQHITQADIGNRKPLILNKAILKSEGDYLLFVDGDCVLRKDFIAAHFELACEKSFLTGRRVELSETATNLVTPELVSNGYLDGWPLRLMWDSVVGQTDSLGRFFKTPRALREIFRQNKVHDIRGCNFSVHKRNLVAINGFGNDFSGAYGEDSDVEIRLKLLGLEMKSVKGAAIQFHLWHKVQEKDLSNQARLSALALSQNARTPNGLSEAHLIK